MRDVDNKVYKINTLFVFKNTIYKLTYCKPTYCVHCHSFLYSECCFEVNCDPDDRDDGLDVFVEKIRRYDES